MSSTGSIPSVRSLQQQYAAHMSWALTENRPARTANARQALENKFLSEAGGDPQRAESLRKAYFKRLAAKSVAARAARKGSDDHRDRGDVTMQRIENYVTTMLTDEQRAKLAELLKPVRVRGGDSDVA